LFVETGLGQLYYLSGNIPAALQTLDAVVKVDSKFFPGQYYLGVADLCVPKYQDTARELEQATRLDPSQPQPFAYLAYARSMAGDRHQADTLLRRLQELRETRYISG
jgi:predicted Zn-dependent protease